MICILQRLVSRLFFTHHHFSTSFYILGISVVLDLTPNYGRPNPWFTDVAETVEKVKVWHFTFLVYPSSHQCSLRLGWLPGPLVTIAKCASCYCVFQVAAEYWMGLGVEGIKVSDLDTVIDSPEWPKLQAVVQTNLTKDNRKRWL